MTFETITKTNFKDGCNIYKEGMETGKATFETHVPFWETWDKSHFSFGRIVAIEKP